MSVTLFVNYKKEQETPSIITKAYSNEEALIGIQADTLEEALRMLSQAEEDARAKMEAWDGSEEDPGQIEEDPKRFISEKDPLQTTAYIDNAVKYFEKHGPSLRCLDLYHMGQYGNGEIWKGCYGAYCLGYKRGRAKGRKEQKAK